MSTDLEFGKFWTNSTQVYICQLAFQYHKINDMHIISCLNAI